MQKPLQQTPSIELLAPAGSFSAFKAALDEGADAIYIGAPHLNARALARDFTYEEIDTLVREAHKAAVRVYIAMNSLVKENELDTAVESLVLLEEIGPDALIIQDLGLLRIARKYFPGIPLHASTLMSVHNSLAVRKLMELGVRRVVLPRELTVEEIKELHRKTGAEIEVFVHGAMCFSYSGLCLFSSMFGGKSSLRGKCVQPCRRRYSWQTKKGRVKQGRQSTKDGGYLFSMNDLCGIDILPQLREAGVSCLKIEGRLKSAEYVRKTVRAYRLLLDEREDDNERRAKLQEARHYLDEAMSRRRSAGFFESPRPEGAITPGLSGNIGIPVGRVMKLEEVRGRRGVPQAVLTVELGQEVRVGDRLRLHDKRTGERTGFTLRTMKKGRHQVKRAAGGKVHIFLHDKSLKSHRGKFSGSLFKVDVSSGRSEEHEAKSFFLKKSGRKLKPDKEKVESILQTISCQEEADSSIQIMHQGRGRLLPIWMRIRSLRDRQYRLPFAADKYIVPLDENNIELLDTAPEKLREQDHKIIWALPPIVQEDEIPWYGKTIDRLQADGFELFQVGHFSQVELFRDNGEQGTNLRLFGNYTCNVLNSSALRLLRETGFHGVQFSMETDEQNLDQALCHFRSAETGPGEDENKMVVGMYVYGHPPLFSSRLDDQCYRYGDRFVSPKGEVFVLERGDGMTLARSVIPFSLLALQKELVRSGVDYLVVDVTGGNIRKNVAELSLLLKRHAKELPVLAGNFKSGLL